ncbi:atp synthase mitochondrial f1 complex assembly factor [Paramyrothecium foliicola]|nr:atp synthase mitochondrial f1 complex assembly factor [Paramyrothecium foliicola]
MASLRLPSLRHLASCPLRSTRAATQRRWAQVHDLRFLTNQPSKAVLEKYREKLHQKAQSEGHQSIDDLKAAYADKIDAQRKDGAIEIGTIPQAPETPVMQPYRGALPSQKTNESPTEESPIEDASIPQAPETPVAQPYRGPIPSQMTNESPKGEAPVRKDSGKSAIKSLGDILDLEKARDLPDKELTAVWRLRHASSPHTLCAVIPTGTYRAMEDAARNSPQFVLPVPHQDQGAEIHFLQWTFDAESRTSTVLFTQLAEYKARGEFSQPHTTVTHHLDLADDRGFVLMQGQVMDGRGVHPEQAKWLVMCLQKFYGGWEAGDAELDGQRKERAAERKQLLEWFSQGDPRFSVEKLLEEAERMG